MMSDPGATKWESDLMTGSGAQRDFVAPAATPASINVAKTLYKIPALLTTYTRCGKVQCRCTAGHLHGPYHALHWRENGRQRRRYVRPADLAAVRAIIDQRRLERAVERQSRQDAVRMLERLNAVYIDTIDGGTTW